MEFGRLKIRLRLVGGTAQSNDQWRTGEALFTPGHLTFESLSLVVVAVELHATLLHPDRRVAAFRVEGQAREVAVHGDLLGGESDVDVDVGGNDVRQPTAKRVHPLVLP